MSYFDELMLRIPTETSILFLGQLYENNLLFKNMEDKYRNIAEGMKQGTSYSEKIDNLLEYCDEKPQEEEAIISNIVSASSLVLDKRFEKIGLLQWNGVVTSLMNTMPGFDLLYSITRNTGIKADYFSEKNLKLTYLFGKAGDEQANIPLSFEEKMRAEDSKAQIWRQIIERVLLRGVLVVDSWDPEHDWLKEQDFNAFISCSQHSIYFFNLSENAKQKPQIKKLISKKIAVVIERSLYDWLEEVNIDIEQYYDEEEEDNSVEITIDSQLDKAAYSIKRLEFSILNQLDRSIIVLDDSILDNPHYLDRKEYFMRFLSTENLEPLWGGYSSGFYFERDIDDKLLKTVELQLKNNDPSKNRVILLEGRNASGKSACLGNLAYKLRSKKIYPVIYITSEMREKNNFEQLLNLIRNHINEKLGARKTVIIWDKNTYDNDEVYNQLRKSLEECNVVIVGSRYIIGGNQSKKNRNVEVLSLEDELSSEEMERLKKSLQIVDSTYAKQFERIVETIKGISKKLVTPGENTKVKTYTDQGNWFLMIMYRLFEDLHDIQKQSVKQETQLAEDSFIEWLEEYSNEKFYKSAFSALYEELGFEYADRLEEHKKFVSDMYNMIAVAGKYGLELPAMVVYRAYSEYENDWGVFTARIDHSSVIEMTQYEDGTLTFRFRRALMAALFLEEQVDIYDDDPDKKLMDIEIDSLIQIIRNTDFDDNASWGDYFSESIQVVNLIRKFGPNGPEEDKYKDYFLKIAEEINKSNNDMNDEAILVACHLIRESFNGDCVDVHENELLLMARNKLHKAINKYGSYNKSQQLSRLKVELCSNLLKSIHTDSKLTEEELGIFNQINEYINDAMTIDLNNFSAGVFLDANLKVYPLLRDSQQQDKVLSRMVQIADNIKDAMYGDFNDNIYGKILKVYELAKKYKQIEEECIRFIKEDSDVGIYREAMLSVGDYFFKNESSEFQLENIKNTIIYLEKYPQIVRKNPRTLYLYIRLLWMEMTKNAIFTEKQLVNWSDKKWKKIVELCRIYIGNSESQKKAFPYFINMINAFKEGNATEYREMINITREFRRKMPAHITFAVICEENNRPIVENVKVINSTSRKTVYSAEFQNPTYKGIEAYFKLSNFKDVLEVFDGKVIENALIGFNMYGVVVYGKNDLKSQIGG